MSVVVNTNTSGGGGSVTSMTATALNALASAGGLTPNSWYVASDSGVRYWAESASSLVPDTLWGGSHIRAALVGDSHMARHSDASLPLTSMTALGQWNWANAMIGSPMVFDNLGWSGDVISRIAARCSAIPRAVQIVVLNLGTNNMLAVSAGASAGTVSSTVATDLAIVQSLVSGLVARGKRVVLTTIYPNNALTSAADARISYLNQMNAGYLALHDGRSVWVVDSFDALRDAGAPTLGTATTDYLDSGGTHLTNLGAQVAGAAAKATLREVAASVNPTLDLYDGWSLARGLYTELSTGTGGTSGIMTGGTTGTIADGWRWLATSSTAVASNVAGDAIDADYVWRSEKLGDARTQVFEVSNAAGGDIEFRSYTDLLSSAGGIEGVYAGGHMMAEFDIEVVSPVTVTDLWAQCVAYVTLGTSPADQGYSSLSGGSIRNKGLASNVLGSTTKPLQAFRGILRTPALRIPENISLSTVTGTASVMVTCTAGGSFQLRISSPRVYVRHYDRW